jgi:hypothetical protein
MYRKPYIGHSKAISSLGSGLIGFRLMASFDLGAWYILEAEYIYMTRIKLFHTFASFIIMVKGKATKIHVENKKYTW